MALERQSMLASAIEAVVNTALGFAIAFYAQHILFDFYEIPVSNIVNAWIVVWMTLLSFARSFVLRRLWNAEFWKFSNQEE